MNDDNNQFITCNTCKKSVKPNLTEEHTIIIQYSLNVIDHKKQPTFKNNVVEDIKLGDNKIRHLCRQFPLNEENDIVWGFRVFEHTK